MKRIQSIIIPLALLTLASCAEEQDEAAKEVPAGGKTIVFTLSGMSDTAEATRATRAIDDVASEATVRSLDVFLFSADGNTRLFYPDSTASELAIDRSTSTVTLTIPDETYNRWLEQTCRIYVIANAPLGRSELEALQTLDAIKNETITNTGAWLFNGEEAPASFFMTGEIPSVTIREQNRQDFGTITLERAAAKIVVDISKAGVTGYLPGEARVRLTNYLDKTKIGGEYPYQAGSGEYLTATKTLEPVSDPNTGEVTSFAMDAANALYTYANDWREDLERETYITLEVDWIRREDATERTYYYRIPFSYINAGEHAEEHAGRIRRNYIYQFMVDISQLGGLDPESAVELQANFDVIDWSERTVEVSILSYHYLFVYNSIMAIHRASSYEWEYKSSLPVEFLELSAECTEYYIDGSSDEITYVPGEPQYPRITPRTDSETGKTYFSISSVVPQNYVPLYIRVKVTNAAQLFSDVELTIYPEQYVTVSYSNPAGYDQAGAWNRSTEEADNGRADWGANYPNGPGGVNNLNFYKITTTQLEEREIWIGDELRNISIGDPARIAPQDHPFPNIEQYYETDPELNHIVSPEFVMASRRGATSNITWDMAVDRCRRYRESQYPAATWRVPTYAELAVISVMQRDDNSAIKDLLSESSGVTYWWTALEGYQIRPGAYTFDSRAGDGSNPAAVRVNGANVPVRCVHDTWRNEQYTPIP